MAAAPLRASARTPASLARALAMEAAGRVAKAREAQPGAGPIGRAAPVITPRKGVRKMGGHIEEGEVGPIRPSLIAPTPGRRWSRPGALLPREVARSATVQPRVVTTRVPVAGVRAGLAPTVVGRVTPMPINRAKAPAFTPGSSSSWPVVTTSIAPVRVAATAVPRPIRVMGLPVLITVAMGLVRPLEGQVVVTFLSAVRIRAAPMVGARSRRPAREAPAATGPAFTVLKEVAVAIRPVGQPSTALVADPRLVLPETVRALAATGAHPTMNVRPGPSQVVAATILPLEVAVAPAQVVAPDEATETVLIARPPGCPVAAAPVGPALEEGVAGVPGGTVPRPDATQAVVIATGEAEAAPTAVEGQAVVEHVATDETPVPSVAGVGREHDVKGDGAAGAPVAHAPAVAGRQVIMEVMGPGVALAETTAVLVARGLPVILAAATQTLVAGDPVLPRRRVQPLAPNERQQTARPEVVEPMGALVPGEAVPLEGPLVVVPDAGRRVAMDANSVLGRLRVAPLPGPPVASRPGRGPTEGGAAAGQSGRGAVRQRPPP